jgi:hypothetical protein
MVIIQTIFFRLDLQVIGAPFVTFDPQICLNFQLRTQIQIKYCSFWFIINLTVQTDWLYSRLDSKLVHTVDVIFEKNADFYVLVWQYYSRFLLLDRLTSGLRQTIFSRFPHRAESDLILNKEQWLQRWLSITFSMTQLGLLYCWHNVLWYFEQLRHIFFKFLMSRI